MKGEREKGKKGRKAIPVLRGLAREKEIWEVSGLSHRNGMHQQGVLVLIRESPRKLLGSESLSVEPDCLRPHGLQSMEFSRPDYWSGQPFPSPGDLSSPGIKPRSPALHTDSLPAEPPGKSKNTGVGSLSLLQGIFPTQELNQGLLHCRQILYQLS